jgi:hypothetical protein
MQKLIKMEQHPSPSKAKDQRPKTKARPKTKDQRPTTKDQRPNTKDQSKLGGSFNQ